MHACPGGAGVPQFERIRPHVRGRNRACMLAATSRMQTGDRACPPPRARGSGAMVASRILNLTLRMGSSHSGPSRVPHWKPCCRAVVDESDAHVAAMLPHIAGRNSGRQG